MSQSNITNILHSVLDVGEIMLTSGAEVNRVEDSIQRMMYAYGCTKVDAFTITSSIVVTVQTENEEIFTQTRRIHTYETNLNKLEMCNRLSRQVCAAPLPLHKLRQQVQEIREKTDYSETTQFIAYGCISAVFSVFFGGTVTDAIAACICGLLLYISIKVLNRLNLQRILQTIISSMCVGLSAVLLVKIGIGESVDKIIIGNIMLLIPGVALTTSLRDMISGDTISGLLGLCEALIRALAIAAGFALVLWKFQG